MKPGRAVIPVTCTILALTAGASTAAAPPPPEFPRTVCTHRVTDGAGDAAPDYLGGGTTKSVIGTKDALDITGVDLRVTSDQLQVFLAIKHIPDASAMAPYEASYRYIVTFKYFGKTFTYGNELRNPSQPAQPLDGSSYPMMNMGTGGNDLPGSTSAFYPAAAPAPSYLVFTSPRAKIEKNLGDTPIAAGDKFTDISATTQVWTSQEKAKGDETSVPVANAVYTVGDDYCFGPPPTSIASVSGTTVQWSDRSTLRATLLSEQGAPVPGKPLDFAIADPAHTVLRATTGADGVAVATYGPVATVAGSYPVTVSFAGDAEGTASASTGSLVVKAETTRFSALLVTKPTSTTRVVTATLLDDDKAAVVGQRVDWYVDGKRVTSSVTDSKGKAVVRTIKPGHSVQAKFSAVAGKYLGASSNVARV